jgi:hypothetical protein
MFEGNAKSVSLGYSPSPYSLKNPANPYRDKGLQGLGAQTVSNPINTSQSTVHFPTRQGQLRGLDGGLGNPVPASGFSGLWDEMKSSLFSPIGVLVLAGGIMYFGYSRGWWGGKEGD